MSPLSGGLSLEEYIALTEAHLENLRELAGRRRVEQRAWVSQRHSEMGNRRHIREWRRLAAAGDPRAAKRGRDYLLAPEAVTEALTAMAKRTPKVEGAADRLRAQLGLVAGGKR